MALLGDDCMGEDVDTEGCGAMTGMLDTPGADAAGVDSADGGANAFSEDWPAAAAGTEVVLEGGRAGGLIAAKYIIYHVITLYIANKKINRMTYQKD